MSGSARVTARRVLLIGATMLAAAVQASPSSLPDELRLGRGLFRGDIDLTGRIDTHIAGLPAAVVRCSNCHAVANGPDVPRSLAPRLDHDLLLRPHSRRGGPASSYDRTHFCTLLRRGLDPALVLISVEMPRYTIDDASCGALWRYVTWNTP